MEEVVDPPSRFDRGYYQQGCGKRRHGCDMPPGGRAIAAPTVGAGRATPGSGSPSAR